MNTNIIIHFIDQATRLSAAVRIPNKNPDTIVNAIMKRWIGIFGAATTFHTDNGGEFVNEQLIQLSQQFGINLNTTAAYSPWSNGTIERHNLVLAEMTQKVIADTNCSFDVALAWALNAKNSLANVHGFSPYQLVMGQNPPLPSVLTDRPPSYSSDTVTSKILMDNLNALHAAREAFVAAESSSRIRRALSSNVRSYSDTTYLPGDKVYYHRQGNLEWRGPATVLGKDGQVVLLKHGGYYIRVHPCRLTPVPSQPAQPTIPSSSEPNTPVHRQSTPAYDEEDEATLPLPRPENVTPMHQSPDISEPETANNRLATGTVCSTPSTQPSTSQTGHSSLSQQDQSSVSPHEQPSASATTSSCQLSPEQPATPTSTSIPITRSSHKLPGKLSPGDLIKVTLKDASTVIVKIHCRSGKATGTWANSWNVTNASGAMRSVDLKKDVTSWEFVATDVTPRDHEFISNDCYEAQISDDVATAMNSELAEWKKRDIYSSVDDIGQDRVTTK